MKSSSYIQEELREISPSLAEMEKINVFTVPDGYFTYLAADIFTGIDAQNGMIKSPTAFQKDIPEGYFDSLAGNILNKIKADTAKSELENLSPILSNIQSAPTFTVPAGFFDELPGEILGKVKPESAKVVSFKRFRFNFAKYAAAAAFVGAMALGVFKFTGKPSENIILPAYVKAGMQVQDIDAALSKIPEAEILKYLQNNPENIDVQTVADKTVNETELPGQFDYLIDENTLDKYLEDAAAKEYSN